MSDSPSTHRTRVLTVDDHPAVPEVLPLRIGRQPDLDVGGEADDVGDALRLVAERAGAMEYDNRDQAADTIIEAIQRALGGKVWLSRPMAERLLRQALGAEAPGTARSPVEALADRELEVFRMIGQSFKTAEIAERLHLSVKTVETYRDRIRRGLDLTDGTRLAHYATEWILQNGRAGCGHGHPAMPLTAPAEPGGFRRRRDVLGFSHAHRPVREQAAPARQVRDFLTGRAAMSRFEARSGHASTRQPAAHRAPATAVRPTNAGGRICPPTQPFPNPRPSRPRTSG